jgi:hypothetical protein
VHLAAIVLAGESVCRLVEEPEKQEEQPELEQIEEALAREVVKQWNVRTDDMPLGDEDKAFEEEEENRRQHRPAAVHKSDDARIEPRQVAVWIPRREADVGHVDLGFTLRPAMALGGQLFMQGNILFLWRLIPEIRLIHVLGKEPSLIRRELCAGLLVKQRCGFVIGTHAIEERCQLPLQRRKAEVVSIAALERSDDGFAIQRILAHDQGRIYTGRPNSGQPASRNLRQRRIESFAQVHRGRRPFARRLTCMDMPGFNSEEGCSTAPTTCTLSLAGSTTGLIRRMRARCRNAG